MTRTNVADELANVAERMPDAVAIAVANGRGGGKTAYRTITFAELDAEATRLTRGLAAMGVEPGDRLVLLVPVGIEFVSLVFALLRSGAVGILIDPGMGRKHFIQCLTEAQPDGFVAVSRAQAVRTVLHKQFPKARYNVTVGRRWFWRGETLDSLRRLGEQSTVALPDTAADDPAAIIFTSGSTGPAKGVLYRHETFATQSAEIQGHYGIGPGGVDLACFALFGLFNSAMGITTVFPDMDFSRPAAAEPEKLLAAARDWQITQAFASPAVWDKLSRHCERTGQRIDSLRKVFSCGAPVPATVLRRTLACVHPHAEMHTPYGATEALPVASIEAKEVLSETAAKTDEGAGICVGRKYDTVDWKIIRITDDPIPVLADAEELPPGEIGELIVRGPQVTREYVTQVEANALAKIQDGNSVWHRMGDVGYVVDDGRFWYCGRKAHCVETAKGTQYPICWEAIFNRHPRVRRTALVGVGDARPAICAEPHDAGIIKTKDEYLRLCDELHLLGIQHSTTEAISGVLLHSPFPVDVRHNAKIDRERLAAIACECTCFDRVLDFEKKEGRWTVDARSTTLVSKKLQLIRYPVDD